MIIDEPQNRGWQENQSRLKLLKILSLCLFFAIQRPIKTVQPNLQARFLRCISTKSCKKITVKTVHSEIPKSYPYIRYKSFTKDLRARIEIFSQDQGGKIDSNLLMFLQVRHLKNYRADYRNTKIYLLHLNRTSCNRFIFLHPMKIFIWNKVKAIMNLSLTKR